VIRNACTDCYNVRLSGFRYFYELGVVLHPSGGYVNVDKMVNIFNFEAEKGCDIFQIVDVSLKSHFVDV